MLDPSRRDLTAGVAGSGTMGRGIHRPSPWLTRRARLGASLLTPE